MDDLDRQFPYPRYLKVPFIFWADGTSEPPEWAQFKRDYPGWVVFRGWFVPEPSPVSNAEPEQHHVSISAPMTEAEAEAAYWAHRGDVNAALAAAKTAGPIRASAHHAEDAINDTASIPVTQVVSLQPQAPEPFAQTVSQAAHSVNVSPRPTQLAANDGTPGNNQAENAQMDAIVRILRLNKDQRRELHNVITGQNYGFQEVSSIAKDMFEE